MNTPIRALALSLSLSGCFLSAAPAGMPTEIHVSHHENVLGTSLDMKVRASSDAVAQRAESAALAEFDRENRILSAWTPDSEFSHWIKTRNTPEHVSPELFQVLSLFDAWREQTGGALDASAETAVQLWKQAAAEHRTPTSAELATAVARMQKPHWRLDSIAHTATHLDDAPIALNSFAKSYITGHAADAALASGASGVMLNVGGDIVLRGDITEPIAIANPKADAENDPPIAMVRLSGRTIATSGSYRRGVDVGGAHYSHIIDPRTALATGEGADAVISSTVVAPDPSEAGALATAFSVMSPAEAQRLAAKLANVEYLLVLRNGQHLASPGWSRLEAPQAPKLVEASYSPARKETSRSGPAQASPAKPLDLLVTLELPRMEDFRYRRPYVAVWIENDEHQPVRTLALWSEKPRYLDELRNWYRSHPNGMSHGGDLSPTVSSATRPPGKYTLRWDGKDDSGKPVKPGKYTLMIEVTREHGGYSFLHQEINVDDKTPAQFQLPAGQEIAGATVDYGRHND